MFSQAFLPAEFYSFKRHAHKMVKHTQTIHQQQPMQCLSVFDHFIKLKGYYGITWKITWKVIMEDYGPIR